MPLPTPPWRPLVASAIACISVTTAHGQVELANSETEFNGVAGQDEWSNGYRNLTADGGPVDMYDPVSDFIPFPVDGTSTRSTTNFWNGTSFDWFNDPINPAGNPHNPPWTQLAAVNTHPNGTNNGAEHWTIRRWTAPEGEIAEPTLLEVEWWAAKGNATGTGTTGHLFHNGALVDSIPLAGNNTAGVTRKNFLTVDTDDHIDLALSPVGLSGDGHDGADSSKTRMIIRTVVDTDGDLLPDGWEETYFPGDLTQLETGSDWDFDGLNDEDEFGAGTAPDQFDTDGDGLDDGWETNDGNFVSETETGTDPLNADTDGDGLNDSDEISGDPQTDPNAADSDGDGHNDADEVLFGSDPNDADDDPISLALADSRSQFSGVEGQDGWSWGYRNYTQDGQGTNYEPSAFIPFPVDGSATRSAGNFWDGGGYDWFNDPPNPGNAHNPPWTFLANEGTHPNGTNSGDEQWTIRRWTASGLEGEVPVRVIWHTRKTNGNNDGVTGSIHLNGQEVDSVTVAGNDQEGFVRFYYLHLQDGDIVDQVLTPEGVNNRSDGSDGAANWMRIDTRIPEIPVQPNGTYFIPNNAEDSDEDGLADFWELEIAFDLETLDGTGDSDEDGSTDAQEQANGTDPLLEDTDGDGLSDGDELALGTKGRDPDSDRDDFSDFHEVATGHDPNDSSSNPAATAIADSIADFPSGPEPQGQNGWTYGYYNTTLDGEPPANANFNLFPTDGTTTLSADNFWAGNRFDWFNDPPNPAGNAHNPPWTEVTATGGHPNGDNNNEVHWATRRWEVDIAEPGPLALNYRVWKTNPNGTGVTAIVLHNGEPVHSTTIAGNDSQGVISWQFVEANPGDTIEIALSPRGTNDSDHDGADGSGFWLLIDPTFPENPLNPDGTPYVPGGPVGDNLLSFGYDEAVGEVTLTWSSTEGTAYQVEESSDLENWNPIGDLVSGQAGETSTTITGAPAAPRYFRVVEAPNQ